MKEIVYVDTDGNKIAKVFDEVPGDGEVVTLEHPLLGCRVDYVVTYHPRPPHRWYADNGARQSAPAGSGWGGGVEIALMPVGPVTVTVREQTAAADT